MGALRLVSRGGVVCTLGFEEDTAGLPGLLGRRFGPISLHHARRPTEAHGCLRAYLDGDLAALDGVAVDPGGTDFQRRVWAALRRIPCGATTTYGALAAALGAPAATRAVGAANARNPIAIVVPCHRVIGADGTLTGYGGGLARKRWLLRHERAILA